MNACFQIEFFELMLPFQQYQAAKREYLRLKDLKNELGAKVKRLKKKNTPITDLKAYVWAVCWNRHVV